MKKYLFLIFLFSMNVFANDVFTPLSPALSLYSEYYPNPLASFKGTIIFENGSGTDLSEWKGNKKFFDCVTQLGSVFLYDRNGLGKSQPDTKLSANNPLTAKLVSDKLTILLKQRHIKPPYLFVAHSYGAMYAGYFVLKNSDLVKGLILVDPVPRNFHFSNKLLNKFKQGMEGAQIKPSSDIYKHYNGPDAEVIYQMIGFDQSKQSIKSLGMINAKIPVIIISSTGMEKDHPLQEDWFVSQKQWLNKNADSKIIRVDSNHFIQLQQPQAVCGQIKQILSEIK